jgi:type 1 fimbriae regulatory protein FimB
MEPRADPITPPAITFLTQDEVRRLFAVIGDTRDRALFQLAYHHGLRASEVSLLHREDLNTQQGRIYIPRVKGSIAKTFPVQPEDVRCLRAYLHTRRDDAPYLFVSSRGIPLERRSYWDLMQKYGAQAGLPKVKRRFHALRHAIAVHLLDAGADVAFVQDRLRHANIQNTILYMRYTTATRDAHTRHWFAILTWSKSVRRVIPLSMSTQCVPRILTPSIVTSAVTRWRSRSAAGKTAT